MTPTPTARLFTRELQGLTKRLIRRASEDTGVSLASIADALERSHGLVEQWVCERAAKHLPVYVLASPLAIPERLYQRIISDIDHVRHAQAESLAPKPEGACTLLLARLGAGVESIARALADGRVTSMERPELLRKLAEIEAAIASVRRSFDLEARRVQS